MNTDFEALKTQEQARARQVNELKKDKTKLSDKQRIERIEAYLGL